MFESPEAVPALSARGRVHPGRARLRPAKGLDQHLVDPEVARRAKLLDADRHSLVALRGLGNVSTHEAVPPRQVEAVV